jgi:hypothetical protein
MGLMIVRAKIKPDCIDEIEAAGRKLFAAIDREQLQGIRYASCRLPDGVTYLSFLQLEEGVKNPLPALPEVKEFQEKLKSWLAEPPTSESLTVIGSYRLF